MMIHKDTTLTGVPLTFTFDLEFSRSNCIDLGNGRPDCHRMKGIGVNSVHALM